MFTPLKTKLIWASIVLQIPQYLTAQFCGFGQEEIYKKCNGLEERLCIVVDNWANKKCADCWVVEFGTCEGQSAVVSTSYQSFNEAKARAETDKNDGDNSCPWYNDQNYRIILDDISLCPALNVNKNPANMSSGSSGGGNSAGGGNSGGGSFGSSPSPKDDSPPGKDAPGDRGNGDRSTGNHNSSYSNSHQNDLGTDHTEIDIEDLIRQAKAEYVKTYYELSGHQISAKELAEWEAIFRSVLNNGELDTESIIQTYGGGKASKSKNVELPNFDSPTIKTFGPNYSGSGGNSPYAEPVPSGNGNLGNGNGMYKEKQYTDPGPIDLNDRKPK